MSGARPDAWKVPAFLDYEHEPLSREILDQALRVSMNGFHNPRAIR